MYRVFLLFLICPISFSLGFTVLVDNNIYENEVFNLSLIPSSSLKLDDFVKINQPELNSNIFIVDGPKMQVDKYGNLIAINYKLISKKSNIYKIRPFAVFLRKKRYFTLTKSVLVCRKDIKTLMPFIKWNILGSGKYYQNQSVLAYLSLENIEDKNIKIKDINIQSMQNASYDSQNISIIKTTSKIFDKKKIYSMPISQYILTLSSSEEATLGRVKVLMNINGKDISLNAEQKKIKIFEVPDNAKVNLAVGNFLIKSSIDKKSVIYGQKFYVNIKIIGQGSLKTLVSPKPIYNKKFLLLTNTEKKEILIPSKKGYKGYKEITYTFVPSKEEGDVKVKIPSFVYLKINGNIRKSKENIFVIKTFSFTKDKQKDGLNFDFLKNVSKNTFLFYLNKYYFLFIFFWIILFLFIKKKYSVFLISIFVLLLPSFTFFIQTDKKLKNANDYIEKKEYTRAFDEYFSYQKNNKENAKSLYNTSILLLELKQIRFSIYFLLSSIAIDSYDKHTFNTLYSILNFLDIKGKNDLKYIFKIKKIILLSKILSLNIICCLLLLFFLNKKIGFFYISLLFFSVFGYFIFFENIKKNDFKNFSIVLEEKVPLKTIPSDVSSIKKNLEYMEIVNIQSSINSKYYFVNTFEGIKGWVLKTELFENLCKSKDRKNIISKISHKIRIEDFKKEKEIKKKEEIKKPVLQAPKETIKVNLDKKSQITELKSLDGRIVLHPLPFSPDNDGFNDDLNIDLKFFQDDAVVSWKIEIIDPKKNIFKVFKGKATPPNSLLWNGLSDNGELVQSSTDYNLVMTVLLKSGKKQKSKIKLPVDILLEERDGKLFMRISSIIFPSDSANLSKAPVFTQSKNNLTLDKITIVLAKYPNYIINILGYANLVNFKDSKKAKKEQEEELIPLSLKRAESVKQELVKRGLNANRIKVEGLGAQNPMVPFSDKNNIWKNRRVEFVLKKDTDNGF